VENENLKKFEFNQDINEFNNTETKINNKEDVNNDDNNLDSHAQINVKQDAVKMSSKTVEIKNLYKAYKKETGGHTVAVKGISLNVSEGECFGLLGTNGAGKTTTFKIMSGQLVPSFGTVKILGELMPYNINKVRDFMGYCPQFDALLPKLSSEEHLELFCHMKGIDPKYHKYIIESSLKNLNLRKYRNVAAGTYSGGNKRKLSVAVALLGKPPIVFLDEPSSGMDPEARRFMWTVINNITNVQKKSSIVLTTHSMEEAEALTNRLVIMVEGRVKVLGNVQAIKNMHGDAFEIDIGRVGRSNNLKCSKE
jgi:ATP-binding cassette subfamily A (ABC1) protein 3